MTPIKAVKDGARSLVVLYHESWPSDYSISVYDGISFITISLGNKFASFEDLDHDGHFEILAQGYLTKVDGRVIEAHVPYHNIEGTILIVYKYVSFSLSLGSRPYFMRVKGKDYESYFVEHATTLIEKKYPEWLEKAKLSSFDDKSKKQLKQILEGWLATIESTQNPALIRSALQKYRELPYPSDEDKQLIIDDLIAVGYSNLKIEDMVK